MADRIDVNVIVDNGNVKPNDSSLFFDSEEVNWLPAQFAPRSSQSKVVTVTMADIMALFGIFPSKGQAKKNGWDRPIPFGFNSFTVGKLKHTLWIFHPSAE